MNLLVIDAQGGGIGRQIISAVKKSFPEQSVTAVGTNSTATSAMLKAGLYLVFRPSGKEGVIN